MNILNLQEQQQGYEIVFYIALLFHCNIYIQMLYVLMQLCSFAYHSVILTFKYTSLYLYTHAS